VLTRRGGRRPAFTGPATQPYSATEVDGWQRLSRVSQNRAAVQSKRGDEASLLPRRRSDDGDLARLRRFTEGRSAH
jgi:hypothetical protein